MSKSKDDETPEASTTEGEEGAEGEGFENGEVHDVPNVNAHVVGVVYVPPTETDEGGGPVDPAPESAKG